MLVYSIINPVIIQPLHCKDLNIFLTAPVLVRITRCMQYLILTNIWSPIHKMAAIYKAS